MEVGNTLPAIEQPEFVPVSNSKKLKSSSKKEPPYIATRRVDNSPGEKLTRAFSEHTQNMKSISHKSSTKRLAFRLNSGRDSLRESGSARSSVMTLAARHFQFEDENLSQKPSGATVPSDSFSGIPADTRFVGLKPSSDDLIQKGAQILCSTPISSYNERLTAMKQRLVQGIINEINLDSLLAAASNNRAKKLLKDNLYEVSTFMNEINPGSIDLLFDFSILGFKKIHALSTLENNSGSSDCKENRKLILNPLGSFLRALKNILLDENDQLNERNLLALYDLLQSNFTEIQSDRRTELDKKDNFISLLSTCEHFNSCFLETASTRGERKLKVEAMFTFFAEPRNFDLYKTILTEFIESYFRLKEYTLKSYPGRDCVQAVSKRACFSRTRSLNEEDLPLTRMRFSQKTVSAKLSDNNTTLADFARRIGNGSGWDGDPVLCVDTQSLEADGLKVVGLDNRRLYAMMSAVKGVQGFVKIDDTSIPCDLLQGDVPVRVLEKKYQDRLCSIFSHAIRIHLEDGANGQACIPEASIIRQLNPQQLKDFCLSLTPEMILKIRQVGFTAGHVSNGSRGYNYVSKADALKHLTVNGFGYGQVKVIPGKID